MPQDQSDTVFQPSEYISYKMLPLFNVSLKKHKNPLNLELLNVCAFVNCCMVSQQTVQHLNIKEVYNLF